MSDRSFPDELGTESAAESGADPRLPSLPAVERRSVELTKAEFREQSDKMIFEGRAAVFGEKAEIGGLFVEQIQRGAFRKSDMSEAVFALNHNYDLVMARSSVKEGPGMLELEEGTRGLDVYAELAPTQTSRDTRELVQARVITQMSFAWPAGATVDNWSDDYTERTITEFKKVLDVSPVVFPAYAGTQASTRSLMDALAESLWPEMPAEQRKSAFAAFLKVVNLESPPDAQSIGRALSQASAELVGGAGLAQELEESVAAMGQRSRVGSFDTRLFNRELKKRGVTHEH